MKLFQPRGNYLIAVSVFLLTLIAYEFLSGKEGIDLLDNKIAPAFENDFRIKQGLDPKLSSNIFLIGHDERSIKKTGKAKLTVTEWFDLLAYLEELNPKAILFNVSMKYPYGLSSFVDKPQYKFKKTYNAISTNYDVNDATYLNVSMPSKFLLPNVKIGRQAIDFPAISEFFSDDPDFFPNKFAGFGDPNVSPDGTIDLIVRDKNNAGLFHFGLLPSNPRINKDKITTDNNKFGNRTTVPINFLSEGKIERFGKTNYMSVYRILDAERREKNKKQLRGVLEESVIILENISNEYTRIETPIGKMDRTKVLLSIVNSALSGNWIDDIEPPKFLSYVVIGLASLLPIIFNTPIAVILNVCIIFFTSFLGLYLFAYHGIHTQWLSMILLWFIPSSITFFTNLLFQEMSANKVKRALTGIMPQEQINQIASNPNSFNADPKEKVITIMFIDIIGFSLVSESTKPNIAFSSLKDTLSGITKIIHKYGGIVDKTLGDGVLCFFGGELLDTGQKENHAENAVNCAREVQQYCVERVLISETRNLPPFPVRIGINTSEVFIGNIGNEQRYDFTIIGSGVNFAQRLEAACEPFKILIGTGTFVVLGDDQKELFVQRHITVKHHEELIEAFEADPFSGNPDLVDKAEQIMRDFHNISRSEERISLNSRLEIVLEAEEDDLKILNFSLNGFALISKKFYGKRVKLKAKLKTENELISDLIDAVGINPVTVEVCWGRVFGDNYFLQGVKILSLNRTQKERLFSALKSELIGEKQPNTKPA